MPLANLLHRAWILKTTGNFTRCIKGKSSILSCSHCYGLRPLMAALKTLHEPPLFFPRFPKCKSPLHGPRNYVDRMCEPSANCSAHTFYCYRAKPKCNFAVRPLYNRSTMLGWLLQTVWVCVFLRRNENKILFGNSQNVLDNGRSGILEGYKRAVCDTCRNSIFC